MPRITTDQILQTGLILAGYNKKQRNRRYAQLVEWFCSNYGAHPLVYAVLWEELRSIDEERKLKYFFLTLLWLKNYDTEGILAGRFNLDEKTIRLWCEYYSECLDIIGKKRSSCRVIGEQKFFLELLTARIAVVTSHCTLSFRLTPLTNLTNWARTPYHMR